MKQKRPRGTGRIYERGSYWWIKYHRNGKPYWESSKSKDRSDAEKLLKSRLGEIADDRFVGTAPGKVTIGMLLDLVAEDYQTTGKRSIDDLRWRVEKHLRPHFDKIKAVQFGSLQIKRYIDNRRKQSAAYATINRELAILQRGFSLALATDPPLITRAPHFPKLHVDNARAGFLEHSQYIALRQALPDQLKCLLVMGYHVGCRLGEMRKLKWDQVDLKTKEIRLTSKQTKGKRGRVIPIWGRWPTGSKSSMRCAETAKTFSTGTESRSVRTSKAGAQHVGRPECRTCYRMTYVVQRSEIWSGREFHGSLQWKSRGTADRLRAPNGFSCYL